MAQTKQPNVMTIVAIGSIPLILTLGNSMLIPILPQMKSELHLSQFQVSLVITVFSITAAVFIPIVGYLADRFSRKKIIIPCLFLYGIGGLIAGFFHQSFPLIMAGRALQGLGAAGTGPIAMALSADLFKGAQESKVLGIVEASNGMGKVLSPIIGSLIALLVWYGAFFAFPAFCALSILLTWIFIKEKKKEEEPPTIGKYAKGLLSVFKQEGRWLFTAYLAGATCLFTLFGILFYFSDVLEKTYDTDGVKKGLILAIPLLVMCVTSYITGSKIGQKQSLMKKLIVLGLALMTISYATLSFFEQLVLFISILVISSVGTGLVLPCINSFITGAVGKDRRGFVTSLYGSVRFLGVAIGPPIFGRLMEWSTPGMFLSIAGLTLAVGILVLLLVHVNQNEEETKEKEKPHLSSERLQPAEER
ncbi:MFS transporter [Bacillus atrophaeus]|nr:MFS transporter [Bacillus atrophaeus]MCY8838384.1 MFS transporter [Bacillus atrophaeus]MEC5219235.1 MFS transporter [Bacillus atrophaeus]MED4577395.1 MFS transporter [Bacillus atrophaeus]MED4720031.1 MFS transporter [Bacillus atrophaeus]MED4847501.1 MFS transporter [Bacillus atrophaeus]